MKFMVIGILVIVGIFATLAYLTANKQEGKAYAAAHEGEVEAIQRPKSMYQCISEAKRVWLQGMNHSHARHSTTAVAIIAVALYNESR